MDRLGAPDEWGFAIYLASKDGYQDSIPPPTAASPAPPNSLDCACGLYLNHLIAWTDAHDDTTRNFNAGNL